MKEDECYRSGEPAVHVDGRKGIIIKPGGYQWIFVKWDGDEVGKLVHVDNLKEPKRVTRR